MGESEGVSEKDDLEKGKPDFEKIYDEIRSGLSTPSMYSVNTSDRRSLDFQATFVLHTRSDTHDLA